MLIIIVKTIQKNNFVISQLRKSNAIEKTKYISLYILESAEFAKQKL